MSRSAMDFIGIGLAAVVFWIVGIIPDYIVALGMVMLWVLNGIAAPEAALSGFGTPTWLYMICIMGLSAVVTKSGILYRFSLHMLKRFPSHYRGQLWGIVAGGILLNPLIPSSSSKVSLGVPIAQTISESMGFRERDQGSAGLGLAAMIFYGFTAPFVMMGSYTNVMAFGLVASTGQSVTWLQWALYALPAFLVFAGVMLAVLRILFKHTAPAKEISGSVLDQQLALLGPLSKEERIALSTVLGCVLLMILQPLHGIDSTWILLVGFAVLVISGVLDRQTLTSGIDWTFLLFLGVAFSFSTVASELGIVDALSAFLGEHMTTFIASPALFLIAVILISFLVTIVVRDDPAVILLVTALLPLAQQAGIHPWILVFVILLSTDPFFFSYQSPTYLTAYYSSEGKAFSHRQGQRIAIGYAAAVIALAVLCVPYWKWLHLIH
ncbi:SLC13 family permease [Paenibacillus hexagrammi]|uniref:Sodium-dependent dicarboxylate transporter SdcS n=1 Tax=Paenibacillus hexagrammi TaxID=2908839 RepID=A0ABY3SJ28_9BACL|nr:SLC13 family permease [Paenibacillus sp. YPD9-1]UJF33941.1 anion permease [Paenibacillus sp. YPD9-1]